MRPRSEAREALARAAERLVLERPAMAAAETLGASYWRIAAHAQVPAQKARHVVRDMARAGELVPCGTETLPHARRPAIRYVPRHLEHSGAQGVVDVMRSWATARPRTDER